MYRNSKILGLAVLLIPFSLFAESLRVQTHVRAGWHVVESANFRIHCQEAPVKADLVEQLEDHRARLHTRWLGGTTGRSWDPKCDVYVYGSADAFQTATRRGPETLAATSLEVGEGRVWRRKVSVRGDVGHDFEAVVEHEVTHVVLADVFRDFQLPRWLDEGIAVSEERSTRRSTFSRQLVEAVEVSRQAGLSELFRMARFPADRDRADLLYAQSASFVEFLLTKKSPSVLVAFAKSCRSLSHEEALRRHFDFEDMAEAEREWLHWTINNADTAIVQSE